MPKHTAFHNPPPTGEPVFTPKDVRTEFARRLSQCLAEKGWNQSELARRASEHLSDGKVSRDNVSCYVRAISLPGPKYLGAISKALGVTPSDLIPKRMTRSVDDQSPAAEIRTMEDGKVWLRVNQAVTLDTGMQIMKLLQKEK
jgi:transcriptional regulator with XRE-family HTH domain